MALLSLGKQRLRDFLLGMIGLLTMKDYLRIRTFPKCYLGLIGGKMPLNKTSTVKRKMLCGGAFSVVLVLTIICVLCGVFVPWNQFSDPRQDFVDTIIRYDFESSDYSTDIDFLYVLSREFVDDWSRGAYLYSVYIFLECGDLDSPSRVDFNFLRVNRLSVYPKQWEATVSFNFEEQSVRFLVQQEESDPPPPLKQILRLEEVDVELDRALEIAKDLIDSGDQNVSLSLYLYNYKWKITYGDLNSMFKQGYPILKIDAKTGYSWQESSPLDQ
jgi:hypothetical protein